MKESTENAKKKNPRLPTAFELAILASFTRGNLRTALHSYLAASEYLKKNGLAELALRHGKLSKKKIEAFGKLRDGGALSRKEAAIEYEKLASGLKPTLKLYKDKRDDQVKSAIGKVTGRSCNYETARDHLKRAWELKPSRYTPRVWLDKVKAANNPWDRWCHKHTAVTQDNGKKTSWLCVPGELLESTLRLVGQQGKHKK